MSGRTGRPRGRPKGSGRGKSRGKACQTDDVLPECLPPSPPPLFRPAGRGDTNSSNTAHGLSPSLYSATLIGSHPYTASLGLQFPTPPDPSAYLLSQAHVSPGSSLPQQGHQAATSVSRASSGTQVSWYGTHTRELPDAPYSQGPASSGNKSGSRQSAVYLLDEQRPSRSVFSHGHVDQQERSSAWKASRAPYQGDFEGTYSLKDTKSYGDQWCGRDTVYVSQGQGVRCLRSHLESDRHHRVEFSRSDLTCHALRGDCDCCELRQENGLLHAKSKTQGHRSYDNQHLSGCEFSSNIRQHRGPYLKDMGHGSSNGCAVRCVGSTQRSSSTDSCQSSESDVIIRSFPANSSSMEHPASRRAPLCGQDARGCYPEKGYDYSQFRTDYDDRYSPPTVQYSVQPTSHQPQSAQNVRLPPAYPHCGTNFSLPIQRTDRYSYPDTDSPTKSKKSGLSKKKRPPLTETLTTDSISGQPPYLPLSRAIVSDHYTGPLRTCDDTVPPFPSLNALHTKRAVSERNTSRIPEENKPSKLSQYSAFPNLVEYHSSSTVKPQQSCYGAPSYFSNDCSAVGRTTKTESNKQKGRSADDPTYDIDQTRVSSSYPRWATTLTAEQRHLAPRQLPPSPFVTPSPNTSRASSPAFCSYTPVSPISSAASGPGSPDNEDMTSIRVSSRSESPRPLFKESFRTPFRTCCPSPVQHGKSPDDIGAVSGGPHRLPESMSWQQQYLKHLEQERRRQQQEVCEEQRQGCQQHRHSPCPYAERQEYANTPEQDRWEQIRKEQMRKQEQQMQREYLKIQREQMLRQQVTQQQEQLSEEQVQAPEQVYKDSNRRQRHKTQLNRADRKHVGKQQNTLHTEPVKETGTFRQDHTQREEHRQRQCVNVQRGDMAVGQSQAPSGPYDQEDRNRRQQLCRDLQQTQKATKHQPPHLVCHWSQQSQQQGPPLLLSGQQQGPPLLLSGQQLCSSSDAFRYPGQEYNRQSCQQLPSQGYRQKQLCQTGHQHQSVSQPRELHLPHYKSSDSSDICHNTVRDMDEHSQAYRVLSVQNGYKQGRDLREQCPAPLLPWRRGSAGRDSRQHAPEPTDSPPGRRDGHNSAAESSHPGFPTAKLSGLDSRTLPNTAPRTHSPVGQFYHNSARTFPVCHPETHSDVWHPDGRCFTQSDQSTQANRTSATAPNRSSYTSQCQSGSSRGQRYDSLSSESKEVPLTEGPDLQVSGPNTPPWLQILNNQMIYMQMGPQRQQQSDQTIQTLRQVAVTACQLPGTNRSCAGHKGSGRQVPMNAVEQRSLRTTTADSHPAQTQFHNAGTSPAGHSTSDHQNLVSMSHQQEAQYTTVFGNENHFQLFSNTHNKPCLNDSMLSSPKPQRFLGTSEPKSIHLSGTHDTNNSMNTDFVQSQHRSDDSIRLKTNSFYALRRPAERNEQKITYVHEELKTRRHHVQNTASATLSPRHVPNTLAMHQACTQTVVDTMAIEVCDDSSPVTDSEHRERPRDVNGPVFELISVESPYTAQPDLLNQNADTLSYSLHPASNNVFSCSETRRDVPNISNAVPAINSVSRKSEGSGTSSVQGRCDPADQHKLQRSLPGSVSMAANYHQDTTLDVPSIDKHQVFVLEPQGADPQGTQEVLGSTDTNTNPGPRRNSWHTPESSAMSGYLADADNVTDLNTEGRGDNVTDLTTEGRGDNVTDLITEGRGDNAGPSHHLVSTATPDPRPQQHKMNSSCPGVSDSGFRISSVFSLATSRRSKRRALSDSVLPEVEMAISRPGFTDRLAVMSEVTKHETKDLSLRDPIRGQYITPTGKTIDLHPSDPSDQKDKWMVNGVCETSDVQSNPLKELTKQLFSNTPLSSLGTSPAVNVSLSAAVSARFQVDFPWAPGAPATRVPKVCTSVSQHDTDCYKDQAKPFIQYPPVLGCAHSGNTQSLSHQRDGEDHLAPLEVTCYSGDNKETGIVEKDHTHSEARSALSRKVSPCLTGNITIETKVSITSVPHKAEQHALSPRSSWQGSPGQFATSHSDKDAEAFVSVSGLAVTPNKPMGQVGGPENDFVKRKLSPKKDRVKSKVTANRPVKSKATAKRPVSNKQKKTGIEFKRNEGVKKHSNQPKRRSKRISARETVTTTPISLVEKLPEKDIRSRVEENWERRCGNQNSNTPKTANSLKDTCKVLDTGRRSLQIICEPFCHGKQLSQTKTLTKPRQKEERTSCGVRGRHKAGGGKRLYSGTDVNNSKRERGNGTMSSTDTLWNQPQSEPERNSPQEDQRVNRECRQVSLRTEPHADMAELDTDSFFPRLSHSSSTDSLLGDANDGNKNTQNLELSSPESRTCSPSSCGEDAEDKTSEFTVLPVLPPSKHSGTSGDVPEDRAALHEHRLRCVELEGHHYVVLEELLAKCLSAFSRAQVEQARLCDLNLPTRSVHLLSSVMSRDSKDSVSVLALSDATRLLNFFHGTKSYSGMKSQSAATGQQTMDKTCRDNALSVKSHSQHNFMTQAPDSECVAPTECSKDSDSNAETIGNLCCPEDTGATLKDEVRDDTLSCTSDQTLFYCDGKPLRLFRVKAEVKSDISKVTGDCPIKHSAPRQGAGKTFRSQTLELNGKPPHHNAKPSCEKVRLPKDDDVLPPAGLSPLLPPLPTYMGSPFTADTVDNDRTPLKSSNTPASVAPRSVTSVQLSSSDHAETSLLEEDVFAGFCHRHSVSGDTANAHSTPPSQNLAASPPSCARGEAARSEVSANSAVSDSGTKRTRSEDCCYIVDVDADETDDVFLEDTPCSKEDEQSVTTAGHHSVQTTSTDHSDMKFRESAKKIKVTSGHTVDKTQKVKRTKLCTSPGVTNGKQFPSSLAERQKFEKTRVSTRNEKDFNDIQTNTTQQGAHVHQNVHKAITSETKVKASAEQCPRDDTTREQKHCHEVDMMVTHRAENYHDNDHTEMTVFTATSSNSADDKNSHKMTPHSASSVLNEKGDTFVVEAALDERGKCSAGKSEYGVCEKERDGDCSQRRSIYTDIHYDPKDHTEVGFPNISDHAQNSPPKSSLHAVSSDDDKVLSGCSRGQHDAHSTSPCSEDKRQLPDDSGDSLKERVQNFIANGSQFRQKVAVRSNSLPDLCGVEEGPIKRYHDSGSFISGTVASRRKSEPQTFACSPEASRVMVQGSPSISKLSFVKKSPRGCSEDMDLGETPGTESGRSLHQANESDCVSDHITSDSVISQSPVEFLHPTRIVKAGESCKPSTPPCNDGTGKEEGEDVYEWSVPCAAHGSVLCACESIDVQCVQEVAASPRVGPWLCTPGTPVPGTPFCDYSKLIYSPFHVIGGMTPARPEPADGTSPHWPSVVESSGDGIKSPSMPDDGSAPSDRAEEDVDRPETAVQQDDHVIPMYCDDIPNAPSSQSVDDNRDNRASKDSNISANDDDGLQAELECGILVADELDSEDESYVITVNAETDVENQSSDENLHFVIEMADSSSEWSVPTDRDSENVYPTSIHSHTPVKSDSCLDYKQTVTDVDDSDDRDSEPVQATDRNEITEQNENHPHTIADTGTYDENESDHPPAAESNDCANSDGTRPEESVLFGDVLSEHSCVSKECTLIIEEKDNGTDEQKERTVSPTSEVLKSMTNTTSIAGLPGKDVISATDGGFHWEVRAVASESVSHCDLPEARLDSEISTDSSSVPPPSGTQRHDVKKKVTGKRTLTVAEYRERQKLKVNTNPTEKTILTKTSETSQCEEQTTEANPSNMHFNTQTSDKLEPECSGQQAEGSEVQTSWEHDAQWDKHGSPFRDVPSDLETGSVPGEPSGTVDPQLKRQLSLCQLQPSAKRLRRESCDKEESDTHPPSAAATPCAQPDMPDPGPEDRKDSTGPPVHSHTVCSAGEEGVEDKKEEDNENADNSNYMTRKNNNDKVITNEGEAMDHTDIIEMEEDQSRVVEGPDIVLC